MITPTFDWTRLWYPLDERPPVESGFLESQPSDGGAPLLDLADTPCLVLLGAPGMGKSYEAQRARADIQARGEAANLIEAQRRRDLGQTLIDLLKSEDALAWVQAGKPWTVLIDGLDELENGASSFNEGLRRFLTGLTESGGDLGAFRLRLFCRTVEWAQALEQTLATLWAPDDLQKRQLAPLSKMEVIKATDTVLGSSAEAARFIADVEANHVEALAAKPVSWRMLVALFQQHKMLPARQADLFRHGIRALLSDQDRASRIGREMADLDTLMIMAGRIATAMALSGAGAITLADQGGVAIEGGAVALNQLAEGSEPVPPFSVRVRTRDLLEVVRSPLFDAIGPETYVWAHQTFMEYLVARYLVAHELEADRLLDFLTVPDPRGSQGGVAPQLREIAAWTAALSAPVFEELLAREPDILLQSDVAAAEPAARARLVDELLKRLNQGELEDTFWRLRPLLSRLDHPKLSEQVRIAVLSPDLSLAARRGAIDIAEETKIVGLASTFVDLALDPALAIALRRKAAGAAAFLGEASDKLRLAEMLATSSTTLDDEIRGAVLLSSWPNFLTVPQLLTALTPPQDPNFIGNYATFLYRFTPGAISSEDALAILSWLEPHIEPNDNHGNFSLRRAIGRLFWAAVSLTHDPAVRSATAHLINVAFDKLAHTIFQDEERKSAWPSSPEDRVALVVTTLEASNDPVKTSRYLRHFAPVLIIDEDLPLFVAALKRTLAPPVHAALAELVVTLSRSRSLDELGDLFDLTKTDAAFWEAWLATYYIALDSPSVEWMRDNVSRQAKAEARREEETLGRQRADTAVLDLLGRIERGEPELWWRLNLQLFVADNGHYQGDLEFKSDLTDTPGWKRLDEANHRRLFAAAEAYLVQTSAAPLDWLGSRAHHRPAAAGYRALRLLHDQRPDRYLSLEPKVWRDWAPAAISFFDNDATAADQIQTEIVARAYDLAPRAVIRAITVLARRQGSEGLTNRPLEVLRQAYDQRLGRALNTLRGERLVGDKADGLIVALLVRHGYSPLIDELKRGLAARVEPANHGQGAEGAPPKSDSAIAASDGFPGAIADLMGTPHADVWAQVEGLSAIEPNLARDIWGRLASSYSFRDAPNLDPLGEDLIAGAYAALYDLFPERPDTASGARVMSAVDFIDRFRGLLLNTLVARGTAEAVQALEDIADTAADDGWARRSLPEAKRAFRAKAAGYDATDALQRIALLAPPYPERRPVESADPPVPFELIAEPPSEPTAPIVPELADDPSSGSLLGLPKLRIVSVATEWNSGHGGVSTLNRELCIALAAQGHEVACVVLDATEAEISQARSAGVRIVRCPAPIGLDGRQRLLLLTDSDFPGISPNVVLGHDQVTGPYALRLSQLIGGAYVHFLHTVPEEIEPLKARTQEGSGSLYRGDEKRQAQLALCEQSKLIVAIGPRIAGYVPYLRGALRHTMIPGFNVELLNQSTPMPSRPHCLIGGRMEDADLKGLAVAGQVIWKLNLTRPGGFRPRLIVRGLDPSGSDKEMEKTGLTKDEWSQCVSPRAFSTNSKEIYGDIEQASVVLMPSLAEGFGLTGFEGVAAGRPVLITQESGLAEWLIQLENSGRISGFKDACIANVIGSEAARIDEWTDKLTKLLLDPDAASERALALREKLKNEFTWDRAASEIARRFLELRSGAATGDGDH